MQGKIGKNNKVMMDRVVFLDRDGVINQESPEYIKTRAEFKFIPGSLEAICRLSQEGFNIIIITNQSVIGRKMVTTEGLLQIHAKLRQQVKNGGGCIKDIFYCPHLPQDQCNCRKPKPALIFQAKKKYNINLSSAIMVGDSTKDIQCAINAGCGTTILVQTGNGQKAIKELAVNHIFPDHSAMNLELAASWIIKHAEKIV